MKIPGKKLIRNKDYLGRWGRLTADALIIERVGYERDYDTEQVHVIAVATPKIIDLVQNIYSITPNARQIERIAREIGACYVQGQKCGKRALITRSPTETERDNLYMVHNTKQAWTGDYYPPSGGGYSYDGEYDYEDGGLTNRVSHTLLCLRNSNYISSGIKVTKKHFVLDDTHPKSIL